LRTPIQNLRGEIEVALGKARTPEEYREVLGSALEECGRLARMIDSLLFLARAENPKTQLHRDRIDVAGELRALRDFYEGSAAEKNARLELHASAELSAELDRALIQRAVGNLIENALAHTPSGGCVTLSAREQNNELIIEVADTGPGITAEHLPYLFDRFYRADRSRTQSTGGVGLGLAIVKGIAELHGGAAEVESTPGKGTTMRLRLPIRRVRDSRNE
jgi:two-component system heavy metal sensor histidine kinase CusS